MKKTLKVTISRTFKDKPMATVHNLPGLDAEMTPAQLRALGAALVGAAFEAESMPSKVDRRELEFDLDVMSGKAA